MKVQLSLLVASCRKRYLSLEELFDNYDNDGSHTLDRSEFQDMLADLSITCKCSIDFDELWASIDIDGDGEITKDEWCRVLQDCYFKSGDDFAIARTKWKIPPKYDENVTGGLVGLVAHNKMKSQMVSFVKDNLEFFRHCRIITTGSTGRALNKTLGLTIHHTVASGPLGGDQEIGAQVTQGQVSVIFFFKDPLSAHQHQADIEALTRICDVHNVPYGTNPSTATGLVYAMAHLGLDIDIDASHDTTAARPRKRQDSVRVAEYKAEQNAVIREEVKRNGMMQASDDDK